MLYEKINSICSIIGYYDVRNRVWSVIIYDDKLESEHDECRIVI